MHKSKHIIIKRQDFHRKNDVFNGLLHIIHKTNQGDGEFDTFFGESAHVGGAEILTCDIYCQKGVKNIDG